MEEISVASLKDLENLKEQINNSFEEVSNMFLELQNGVAMINERLDLYNKKSSHKI